MSRAVDGTKCRDPLYRLGFLKKYLNGAGARRIVGRRRYYSKESVIVVRPGVDQLSTHPALPTVDYSIIASPQADRIKSVHQYT